MRPFRDGDSPRQVDWKAYAREAPLLVKEYSAMGSELRMFDFSQLGNLGTEARLEQLRAGSSTRKRAATAMAWSCPGCTSRPTGAPIIGTSAWRRWRSMDSRLGEDDEQVA